MGKAMRYSGISELSALWMASCQSTLIRAVDGVPPINAYSLVSDRILSQLISFVHCEKLFVFGVFGIKLWVDWQ
ncbi:MAG: hypothetical protein GY942_03755 [Aestuariibacter sp.]|nr:hypothetical protein [Aestuariibacter sp.]